MPQDWTLKIFADEEAQRAELRLLDSVGVQQASHFVDFGAIRVSTRHTLLDLRAYLRDYVEEKNREAELARVGVELGELVLGTEILGLLWAASSQRTLEIVLPEVLPEASLAMSLVRIPWEIARPAPGEQSLAERNLRVRMVPTAAVSASKPLPFEDELRILFVLTETRGIEPLGMRQERQELLELFAREVYPQRRVVAHFLSHGVTRELLREQLRTHRGYHVVHWSGHGAANRLVLCRSGGAKDSLSGAELLGLLVEAGGYLPWLFVLSACQSGVVGKGSLEELMSSARGESLPSAVRELKAERHLKGGDEPGYTSTAHELLRGGIPAVLAMRYSVSDEYTRELAKLFYRFLLADAEPKAIDEALALARQELWQRRDRRFDIGDPATPLLYGDAALDVREGRSSALEGHKRRIHDVRELRRHAGFVGRTWELADLGADFFGTPARNTAVRPVAQIVGLGGMGKTALAAEILDLWEDRFDWVLIYQGKPNALAFDATLQEIHLDLKGEGGVYARHVTEHRADAIWQESSPELQGERRLRRMISKLVRALEDEKILLVFDNFETALKPHPERDSESARACQDPWWDACFVELAEKLGETGSRLVVTTRYPLAALVEGSHQVELGPLPAGEAELFLRQHSLLRRLLYSENQEERALVQRLLKASRFHPLLMDRLARLAGSPELRHQLLAALEILEKRQGYADLPDLFGAAGDAAKERAYLRDALESSLDLLLREVGADARRLLWVISLMNQPEAHSTLQAAAANLGIADLEGLLRWLVSTGLVTEEGASAADEDPNLACHELVRERIRVFMEPHPHEIGELTANAVRLAYADQLAATFRQLLHQDGSRALAAGSRALVYCVDAEAWDRLGDFASGVVINARSPRFLATMVSHLQKAAEAAPQGRPSWSSKTNLADALRQGGRADASLPLYAEAANAARIVAAAGGGGAAQALVDLAAITGNWANALVDVGQMPAARERFFESAEAFRQAGSPAVHVLAAELEAARIAVMLGQAEEVLNSIETGLELLAGWWLRHRAGEKVAEAPDAEVLARALVSALDIAKDARFDRKDWNAALECNEAKLEVKRQLGRPAEDIAGDRMNRANILGRLGRFGEAKAELDACLQIFGGDPWKTAKTLSSLADLFNQQGDVVQAIVQERRALGLREHLPDLQDRAISHNGLANYLERRGLAADLVESRWHRLAALVYRLVAGLGQHLKGSVHNYAIRFRRARDAGQELEVPRLAELLADPAFAPVGMWLEQRGERVEEVQAQVDGWLARVREEALASEG